MSASQNVQFGFRGELVSDFTQSTLNTVIGEFYEQSWHQQGSNLCLFYSASSDDALVSGNFSVKRSVFGGAHAQTVHLLGAHIRRMDFIFNAINQLIRVQCAVLHSKIA